MVRCARRRLRQIFVLSGVLLLAGIAQPRQASAWDLYYELGFGFTQLREASNFFGTTSANLDFNFGLSSSIFYNFSGGSDLMYYQLGLKHMSSTGAEGSNSYALHAFYPTFRVEFPRFYLGFGITPYSFTAAGLGFDNLQARNELLYYTELGLMWKVVPFFYLSLEVSGQWGNGFVNTSPGPILGAMMMMRFFIFEPDKPGTGRAKYDGWRYPFGIFRE